MVPVDTTPQSIEHRFSFAKLKSKIGNATGRLYGREDEQALLQEAWQRCVSDNQQELLLISGHPGAGKTALATSLRHTVIKEKGFFVSGKFEEQAIHEPYEVLLNALTEYVDQILDASDTEQWAKIRTVIENAMGNEVETLSETIPALHRIFSAGQESHPKNQNKWINKPTVVSRTNRRNNNNNKATTATNFNSHSVSHAQDCFRLSYCTIMKCLVSMAPLVLFLDDLQWADTASMELVRNLMHTEKIPLLLIGAHRCDLENPDPSSVICIACMEMKPFVATMKDLEKEHITEGIRMRTIDLKSLNVNAINILLRDLLDKNTAHDTMNLSNVILQQSQGNVFHVLQFVRLLLDQGFLMKDDIGQWTWDDTQLVSKDDNNTFVSPIRQQTIIELIRCTIESLPRLAQEALKVASCMSDEIDDSALDLVLQTPTSKHLEHAADEGLLVFLPQTGGYRFAHDWIRTSAYNLIPKNEREEFHLKIGRKLWKSSNVIAIQKNIFVLVCLLNKGTKLMKEERERYKVAELNLEAAERAASVSAFPDASRFAKKGIQLLGRNRWNDYYDLSLSLYSLAAEVESINGNYERVVKYIEEVSKEGTCLEDKLRAYSALIRSMGQQDNLHEAAIVGIDVLRQLGEPIPSNPSKMTIGKELMKVKFALRGKSNNDLLNLPMMKNQIKSAVLQILNLVFVSSYSARAPFTPLIAFKSILITLRYGLHGASSVAFAVYGTMLCGLGLDVVAGRRYGELALAMAEKLHSREHTYMAYYLFGAGVFHWSGPIVGTFDYLLYASRAAMEIGDSEIAAMSKLVKSIHSFYIGYKIDDCIEEVNQCISAARLYRKHTVEVFCLIHLQMYQCYKGLAKNPARLDGSSIKFDDVMKECVELNSRTCVAAIYLASMRIAYSFGDYDYADQMAEGNRDLQKNPSALLMTVENRYKEGLIAVALARAGKDVKKNKKIATDMLKKLILWSKDSPDSHLQKKYLLEAEIKSLNGNNTTKQTDKSVCILYEKSIEHSKKMNYRNEMALTYERYGEYKNLCGDLNDAQELYNKSITMYREWGALGKVQQMTNRISELVGIEETV